MYNTIKYLNKDQFEIYIFYTLQRKDIVSKIFIDMVQDKWIDISNNNPFEMQGKIIESEIDILFDCSGHTAGGKLELFYNRSAPVQAHYCGYPFTTGLKNIDYRLRYQDK
jgi:predicted O-linked N-acetylglucosamine transferase (SPINDLY family)